MKFEVVSPNDDVKGLTLIPEDFQLVSPNGTVWRYPHQILWFDINPNHEN